MSNYGIGYMLNVLSGEDHGDIEYLKSCYGKVIKSIEIVEQDHCIPENKLYILFEDDTGIVLYDDGQSCCEHRYMHTDDKLNDFVDTTLLNIRLQDCESVGEDYEVLDSQFLIIDTSLGQFTVVNYNKHNGYYGGFWIRVESVNV